MSLAYSTAIQIRVNCTTGSGMVRSKEGKNWEMAS